MAETINGILVETMVLICEQCEPDCPIHRLVSSGGVSCTDSTILDKLPHCYKNRAKRNQLIEKLAEDYPELPDDKIEELDELITSLDKR